MEIMQWLSNELLHFQAAQQTCLFRTLCLLHKGMQYSGKRQLLRHAHGCGT